MTWLPTRSGVPISLVEPTAAEVDFAELAWSLANLNRFAGHPQTTVSVGLHTLIGLNIAPPPLKAHWLLHDAHESRTGDVTSPAKDSLDHLARLRFGPEVAEQIRTVRQQFEQIHDVAIHAAAGLDMPTAAQRETIKQIDLIALATEKRWFCAPCPRPWFIDGAGIQSLATKPKWMPPDRVADALLQAFLRHLPALKGKSGRAVA
ncbi:hypothetical protein [Methylobacterium frigidaeris]|uniref:Phosphohydrolase n=1 Tax=Methylobacterium frigidaeris TaxID=2038277 RepID=A0AA37HFX8_9HYPH|nr:hypothetical protein [Methylobacterium frigidaeris]PIK74587.1 hypothetical protein CS379_01685 [Methylobacterium frigidaeris]GJD65150.1 hypothetical protein MPEAHAMD_5337 [Methylobacterium frigidaeris]